MSAPFNLAQSFNEALALQRQGRLREAEKIYARVLKAAPDHFDALNLLGTVKAPDWSTQLTYGGHPLYYFVGDTGPGTAKGQNSKAFGAGWYVVAPSGKKIDTD